MKILLKEKLENLKSRQTSKSLDDWMDNQEVCTSPIISPVFSWLPLRIKTEDKLQYTEI